jgi:hypothetical protein
MQPGIDVGASEDANVSAEHVAGDRSQSRAAARAGSMESSWTLIAKSSVAAESCGRTGKPMQECLIATVVLQRSDRVTE